MSSVMDKLGKARWWAADVTLHPERYDQTAAMLVDVIGAVEELATERQDKPAAASAGYGALPTAQEIVDAWSKVPGIIVDHRAMLVVEMVRARVMPELASRDKRIAELEKQFAALNNWAVICGGKAPAVDGKTPGQVNKEAYKQAVMLHHESEGVSAWGMAAQAVLRAFGPALAKQAVADALGRVRERIETDGLRIFEGERYGIDAIGCAVAMIDVEISALEAPKPAPDHVHELGSCSFCDKRPTGQEFVKAIKARLPKAGVNITVENPVHWGVIDDVVGELFAQWRAESSPK